MPAMDRQSLEKELKKGKVVNRPECIQAEGSRHRETKSLSLHGELASKRVSESATS